MPGSISAWSDKRWEKVRNRRTMFNFSVVRKKMFNFGVVGKKMEKKNEKSKDDDESYCNYCTAATKVTTRMARSSKISLR